MDTLEHGVKIKYAGPTERGAGSGIYEGVERNHWNICGGRRRKCRRRGCWCDVPSFSSIF